MKKLLALLMALLITTFAKADSNEEIAERIVSALQLQPGERVLLRYDPEYMQDLVLPLRKRIRAAGAVDVAAMEYVKRSLLEKSPDSQNQLRSQAQLRAFSHLLEGIDVYIWLAASEDRDLYPEEDDAIRAWLLKGAKRREIHFHWASGTMMPDGLPGIHSPELDEMYRNAMVIDYQALSAAQDRAIQKLRTGTVRVRTPAGTDVTFQIGNRPFNKQNGDASPARALAARVLVDREIEFPAGVIRVAPLETTVQGTIVIPQSRFGDIEVRNLKLEFRNGKVIKIDADENAFEVEAQLAEIGDAGRRFREFALGMNPNLKKIEGSDIVPYYGYGAGVVRLALGDNQEIGGIISGGYVRWFFFPDATVEVNGETLVDKGELIGMN